MSRAPANVGAGLPHLSVNTLKEFQSTILNSDHHAVDGGWLRFESSEQSGEALFLAHCSKIKTLDIRPVPPGDLTKVFFAFALPRYLLINEVLESVTAGLQAVLEDGTVFRFVATRGVHAQHRYNVVFPEIVMNKGMVLDIMDTVSEALGGDFVVRMTTLQYPGFSAFCDTDNQWDEECVFMPFDDELSARFYTDCDLNVRDLPVSRFKPSVQDDRDKLKRILKRAIVGSMGSVFCLSLDRLLVLRSLTDHTPNFQALTDYSLNLAISVTMFCD